MEPEDHLRQLFVRYHRAVLAYVARRTVPPGNVALAEDVTAMVFTIAWRRLDQVPAGALPWLLVTARNVLSEHRRADDRRASREVRLYRDRSLTQLGHHDSTDALAASEQVRDVLAQLNERDRELAMLVAWDDLSLVDAAQVLGVSPAAARTRWRRLRVRMTALLAQEDAHPQPTTPSKTGSPRVTPTEFTYVAMEAQS